MEPKSFPLTSTSFLDSTHFSMDLESLLKDKFLPLNSQIKKKYTEWTSLFILLFFD